MLDINPLLLLLVAGVFLGLIAILNKILYVPMLNFMEKRDESIKKDMESAGKNSSDIESYLSEAEEIILKAKAEASKIKDASLHKAKQTATEQVEEKKAEFEADQVSFLEELESEKTEFKNGLMAQMPAYKEGVKVKLSQI